MDPMHAHHHSPIFVALSLGVAILGSWTALDLFRRVHMHLGGSQRTWLIISAVAMGASIWSMHFIAMLGFTPGSAVAYDPLLTLVSLVLAIGATGAAFSLAGWRETPPRRIFAAGGAMGAGICLMHYVGMAAVRTAESLGYDWRFVIASFVIAVAASTAALFAARREHSLRWRSAAAVALGLAIGGMHYTAMAGLRLVPIEGAAAAPAGAPPYVLAVSVAGGTLLILFMALIASLYDQRGNVLSALDAGGVGYWELDWRTRVLNLSPRAKQIFRLPSDAEVSYADLMDLAEPDSGDSRSRALQTTLRTGAEYDVEYRLKQDGRWVNVRGRLTDRASRRSSRMAGVVIDVTDRHEAFAAVSESERRQRILIDELNHRVKNTLATVQSIALQTAKGARSVEDFLASFEGRLTALSRTHDALTHGSWELAGLRDLLEREFRPYRREQVVLEGADVELGPRHALSLGMVFHELVTNAARYGALSVPSGQVRVTWSVLADGDTDILVVEWGESGGPIALPPVRPGFGSRLIRLSVEHDLDGKVWLDYGPDGLRCTIRAPFARPRLIDSTMARFSF